MLSKTHGTDLEVWSLCLINNEAHEDVELLIVRKRISVKYKRNNRREAETPVKTAEDERGFRETW